MKWSFAVVLICGLILGLAAHCQTVADLPIEKDIVYGKGADVDLKLNLARPPAANGPVPAVVCVHGGGWQSGSKDAYDAAIRMLAASGYVAVAIEYRFAPKYPWPAQIEDTKCAVRYLRAHAKELSVNPDKIGAMGDSAGGHLSLLLGLMDPKDGLEGTGGNAEQSSKVQAVVNLYGPTDMRLWRALPEAEAAAQQSMGKGFDDMLKDLVGTTDRTAPVVAQASPVTYIDKGDPPILTFHGTKDPVVPFPQAEILQKALEAGGVVHRFVPLEGAGHGLDPILLAAVTQQTLAFFNQYLKGTATSSPVAP